MTLRERLLSLVVARDKRTLDRWLDWLEALSIAGSFAFLLVLILLGLENADLILEVKFGFFAVILIIGLTGLGVLQYLLLIEWHTRKR